MYGLEHGRATARRRSSRRRRKNTVLTGFLVLTVLSVGGWIGYLAIDFYRDEQQVEIDPVRAPDGRTAEEMIDDLSTDGRWNGPGVPSFGVGGDPDQP